VPSRNTSASPIERLIADLRSTDAVRRDAAVARLRVLGAKALPRLAAFIASAEPSSARALAVTALDGIDSPRAVEIALACLDASEADIVVAALGALRGWVSQESGTRVLEAITAVAVDRARDGRVRLAAIDALSDLPDELVQPIRAQAPPPESAGPTLEDPVAAREWVDAHGAQATLAKVHDAIKAFREHEILAPSNRHRDEWMQARGAAHRALASRGSRLALYDAVDTVRSATGELPSGFVEALHALGDASCLEPLARAWSAAPRGSPWRARLEETARDIVRRSKLGHRSAVLKEIRATWQGFV
jgi:hypothetical protein